jgi:hypothetical protein
MQCWLWYISYSIPVSNYLKPFFWFDFGAIGKPCRTLKCHPNPTTHELLVAVYDGDESPTTFC